MCSTEQDETVASIRCPERERERERVMHICSFVVFIIIMMMMTT